MNVRAWFKARRQRKAREQYLRQKAREAFKYDDSPQARQIKQHLGGADTAGGVEALRQELDQPRR